MSNIKDHLASALEWKYGAVASTAGEKITGWRHATLPEPTDLAVLVADYMANELPNVEAARKFDMDLIVERIATAALRGQPISLPQDQIDAIVARRKGRDEGPI